MPTFGPIWRFKQRRLPFADSTDSTLSSNQQLGLHPDLGAFKSLYDSGKLTMVQNAGYANNNKSHFQAKDDWLTGSDSTTQYSEGWMANFLNTSIPATPPVIPIP
ncbi:MAG: hypothetical protein R3B47_21140 [Bacteroidia bacterium]